ncbi:MAG: Sua5 family C-terminal domain-containing protein, partial [Pseudomonadota bacterium]
VAEAALGGGTTVALRVPQVTFFRDVVGRTGPLVAPSANRSGRVSATSAEAVMEELHGLIDLVVDDGPSPIGVESTVIDVTGAPRLLRPGAIPLGTIEAVVGPVSLAERAGPLRSPGLLHSHYAPRALLRLDVPAKDVRADEGWLAFGEDGAQAAHIVRLSPSGDLDEAARGLYAGLRALDATGVGVIAVSPIPNEGVGVAIRDRLMRAAAPREGDG